MKYRRTLKHAAALTLSLLAASSWADWSLDSKQTSLNFVSIKKGFIGEVHSFKALQGTISKSGAVTLTIDLSSVATNIDIRDQRMSDMLFEVSQYPNATITAQVDPKSFKDLDDGDTTLLPVELTLNLHGMTKVLPATLRVTGLDDDALLVTTEQPIVINSTDFNLVNGIEQLREVAGLPSIAIAVPVTATMVFTK